MKKRILSMMLVLCMVLGMMPVSAFAAETDNLCDHHTEHTADCGYAPAVEGSPCTHECGEECAEACGHVHDELCGYVEAAAEVPCGYVCEESHGEATRVIYVDESTFWASGYSEFYDADGNQLTATREEQEDGWVKYTIIILRVRALCMSCARVTRGRISRLLTATQALVRSTSSTA